MPRLSPVFAVLVLALAGCRAPTHPVAPALPCVSGQPVTQTTLWFGLNRPQGPAISDAEWQSFVDGEVTPRFKDGLTVLAAQGQWLGNDGRLAKEQSRGLMLIHAADRASNRDIDALRAIYRQRFAQDSVMRVDTAACVAF